jgi:hypothetical protein
LGGDGFCVLVDGWLSSHFASVDASSSRDARFVIDEDLLGLDFFMTLRSSNVAASITATNSSTTLEAGPESSRNKCFDGSGVDNSEVTNVSYDGKFGSSESESTPELI